MRRAIATSSVRRSSEASAKPKLELVCPPIARPLTPADVRRLGDTIRALARGRSNSLHYYLTVAKHVVDELYGGRLTAMRSEVVDIDQKSTFREIARELRGTITKTTLHRALWAYEVRETTPVYALPARAVASGPEAVPTLEQLIATIGLGVPMLERVSSDLLDRLAVSHLYEVRCLDTPERSLLLSRAVHGAWSVRRLRHEIEQLTGRAREPRGSGVLQLLLALRDVPATLDLTPLASLSARDARRYQAIAAKLHDLTGRIQDVLAKQKSAKERV